MPAFLLILLLRGGLPLPLWSIKVAAIFILIGFICAATPHVYDWYQINRQYATEHERTKHFSEWLKGPDAAMIAKGLGPFPLN